MIPIKSIYSFVVSLRLIKQVTLSETGNKLICGDYNPSSLARLKVMEASFREMAEDNMNPYISLRYNPSTRMKDLLIELCNPRVENGLIMVRVVTWKDPRPFKPWENHFILTNDAQGILMPPPEE